MFAEKDLEAELEKQFALTLEEDGEPPSGHSSFAFFYVAAYKRLLPGTVLFDDVREKIVEAYAHIAFLRTADERLPWVALRVYVEALLLPRLSDANGSQKNVRELLDFPSPEEQSALLLPRAFRLAFIPFVAKLEQVAEEQYAGLMEDLFQSSSPELGRSFARAREKFIGILQLTRWLFRHVFESDHIGRSATALGIIHAGFFTHVDGDVFLGRLWKGMYRNE